MYKSVCPMMGYIHEEFEYLPRMQTARVQVFCMFQAKEGFKCGFSTSQVM